MKCLLGHTHSGAHLGKKSLLITHTRPTGLLKFVIYALSTLGKKLESGVIESLP